MTFFDRRKGYGEHTVDRRRSYVVIMERVLGTDVLSRSRQRRGFLTDVSIAAPPLGTVISSIEVTVLSSIDPDRDRAQRERGAATVPARGRFRHRARRQRADEQPHERV